MEVATLIPAYKIKYIAELFACIQNQTVKPSLIIVSDDNPDGDFLKHLASDEIRPLLKNLNIYVTPGPKDGAYENLKNLLRLWNQSTDLFHVMLDDDVIYPDFYERHILAHKNTGISCSISRRWVAGDGGFPIQSQSIPKEIAGNSNRILEIAPEFLFSSTVAKCSNWLGEFSNTIFHKKTAPLLFSPEFEGVSYAGLWDLGAFLASSLMAPLGYIQENLGFFRKSDQGHSSQIFGPYMKSAVVAYAALAIGAVRLGKLEEHQKYDCFEKLRDALEFYYPNEQDMQLFSKVLSDMLNRKDGAEDLFLKIWKEFLEKNNLNKIE